MKNRMRGGFTLIELLTVIAIIVLLIGILVPSLSAARNQARNASTSGQIAALEKGCIAFQGDNEKFPVSRGLNPFEQASQNALLTGAHWLAMQLVGPDMQGWVKPDVQNDVNNDQKITDVDWLAWYWSPGSSGSAPTKKPARLAPYVDVNGKFVVSYEKYRDINTGAVAPDPASKLEAGNSDWKTTRIPFFVDAFGFPVLYYRADKAGEQPITTQSGSANMAIGRYDQADNASITGSNGANGRYPLNCPGWDVAGGGLPDGPATGPSAGETGRHALGYLGYTGAPNPQTTWPEKGTFAAAICDRNIFDSTKNAAGTNGKLWPVKAETFIIISAGKDGIYGNEDDIKNYDQGK